MMSVSGSAGEDREYGYSLTADRDGGSRTTNTSLGGQYMDSKLRLNGSLNEGDGYSNASIGGSVVVHPQGVTLTPYIGETMAVVSVLGATGAKVMGYSGVRLDGSGNAVVTYLQPYQLNKVAIDPEGTDQGVELNNTSRQVGPRTGGVVAVNFAIMRGDALLPNVRWKDQSPLPFGGCSD